MIRAPRPTPQQQLADAIHGTIIGPSTIRVGTHLVVASPIGVVRVDRTPVGMWSEPTTDLAARVAAVIGRA